MKEKPIQTLEELNRFGVLIKFWRQEQLIVRKLKIYLDTSVISHLQQEDVPEKMSETLRRKEKSGKKRFNIKEPDGGQYSFQNGSERAV